MKFTFSSIVLTAALLTPIGSAQDPRPASTPAVGAVPSQPASLRPLAPATADLGVVESPLVQGEVAAKVRDGARLWTDAEQDERVERAINEPLSVNGVVISPVQIRSHLVQVLGRMAIESRKLDLLITAEIKARAELGLDPASFELTEEESKASFEDALSRIKAQYPNESIEDVLAVNKLDLNSLASQLTQTKRFDRVFLPDNPNLWPATTIAALEKALQPELVVKMQEAYNARVDADGNVAPADQGQAMFQGLMRRVVIQALMANAEIMTTADGLPDGVLQRVNGEDTLLADIYPQVAKLVHPEEVHRVRTYLARLEATRQALTATGSWLTDEEFNPIFDAEAAVGADSPFNLTMIALSMKRYPTMDVYKSILRGVKSYEKSLGDNLNDEALTDWLPRAGRMLGMSEVDCQILLVSAFDYPRNDWKDNGWVQAEEAALSIAEQLAESEGEAWDMLIESSSEFFDPPTQAGAAIPSAGDRMNKGRFGKIHRNRLMQKLNESEYTAFVDGSCISDAVYYDQEVGTIDGPFLGKFGYYFTRVDGRTPPKKQVSLADADMRSMVTQDYLMTNFIGFASEALDNAEVVGL